MGKIIVVECDPIEAGSIEEALEIARRSGGHAAIIVVEGDYTILKPIRIARRPPEEESVEEQAPARPRGRLALVLDQMFRGFAGILARELAGEDVEIHEILGRGLEAPVREDRVTRWPAHDDYDVLKIAEALAREGKTVILYTGDKKLARQARSLGLENLHVEYMPPNEYPGKETLARAMLHKARELAAKT